MIIKIAHRGNIDKVAGGDNNPDQIIKTIEKGYHAEVDVWYNYSKFYLGHDEPRYPVTADFLKDDRIWCHAKSEAALNALQFYNTHYFWHYSDRFTLTSKGYIWTCDVYASGPKIIIMLEHLNLLKTAISKNIGGICCDDIDALNIALQPLTPPKGPANRVLQEGKQPKKECGECPAGRKHLPGCFMYFCDQAHP